MTPAALPHLSAPSITEGTCRACGYPQTDDYHFIERDLCALCHGPAEPTRRQAGEIARIRERHGPLRLTRGRGPGQLELAIVEEPISGYFVRPAVLTIDVRGRVVHRLEREVTPREQTAV